jgi:hypothetical protein
MTAVYEQLGGTFAGKTPVRATTAPKGRRTRSNPEQIRADVEALVKAVSKDPKSRGEIMSTLGWDEGRFNRAKAGAVADRLIKQNGTRRTATYAAR